MKERVEKILSDLLGADAKNHAEAFQTARDQICAMIGTEKQSAHQRRVELFMQMAGQEIPKSPTVPPVEVRKLRAKLILEETLETVAALGFDSITGGHLVTLREEYPPDLIQIADGCADISVVTMGTLSACGIKDCDLLFEVDASNLRKFGPGGHRRKDGKWIKPFDWQVPDIKKAIGL